MTDHTAGAIPLDGDDACLIPSNKINPVSLAPLILEKKREAEQRVLKRQFEKDKERASHLEWMRWKRTPPFKQ